MDGIYEKDKRIKVTVEKIDRAWPRELREASCKLLKGYVQKGKTSFTAYVNNF